MNSRQEEIEKLLERFYAASLSSEEMQSLYTYFLYTNPLPDKFKDEAPLLQELGIRYFCQQDSAALESKIDQWYEEENTTTRFVKIVSLSRAAMKRIAAAAACVAAIAVGFWAVSTNVVPTMPTYDMLQPTQVAQAEVPVKQHTQQLNAETDTTTTATDNEIKNTANQTATLPTADAPQPDITATTTIVQEPVPVLLAEAEIQLEQNYTAIDNTNTLSTDTILQLQTDLPKYETNYLAYADTANNNNHIPDISNKTINEELCSLNMIAYCNTKCNSNDVVEIIFKGTKI